MLGATVSGVEVVDSTVVSGTVAAVTCAARTPATSDGLAIVVVGIDAVVVVVSSAESGLSGDVALAVDAALAAEAGLAGESASSVLSSLTVSLVISTGSGVLMPGSDAAATPANPAPIAVPVATANRQLIRVGFMIPPLGWVVLLSTRVGGELGDV